MRAAALGFCVAAAAPQAHAQPAAAAAPQPLTACPHVEGVWTQPNGARILVMEQDDRCRITAKVQEPRAELTVKGFWTGRAWTIAASRAQADGCRTTAWGSLRAADADRLLINVRGSDGLCAPDGKPQTFDATMTYLRVKPPAPAGG